MHDRIKAKKHFLHGLKNYARGKVADDLRALKPKPPADPAPGMDPDHDPMMEGHEAGPPDDLADLKSNPELLQKLLAEIQAKQ